MLFALQTVKMLAEIALLALAGRAVLGWMTGPHRAGNAVWRLFDVMVNPLLRLTRRLTPRRVLDRHLGWVLLFWLGAVWMLATVGKIRLCLSIGVQQCH